LNLRGSDIDYNPVFLAYLVVPATESDNPTLFLNIDPQDLSQEVYDYLDREGILIEPYSDVEPYLRKVAATLPEGVSPTLPSVVILSGAVGLTLFPPPRFQTTVLVPSKTSLALTLAIGLPKCSVERSPVADLKAIKNEAELRGFRECHKRDGVALVRYFAWLEAELNGGAQLREYDAATKLEQLRAELDGFRGLSFDTISSTGPNGAIIHYQPTKEGSAVIDKNKIYLCDSGAQFNDGTTE
jgi:Xaa-Pro aminopeptidase